MSRAISNSSLGSRLRASGLLGLILLLSDSILVSQSEAQEDAAAATQNSPQPTPNDSVKSLFDGQSLSGWSQTKFGGQREVTVVDGAIQLDAGEPLTGITFSGEVPTDNFEIALQARKLKGNDFFCAATFPVAESHCTLVLGGWGGTVVGLSCLDGLDASENETTKYIKFETDRWYAIRIRVDNQRIQCWLDDENIVDVAASGRKISVRTEVLASRPLGICSFVTQAQLRDIKLTQLDMDQPTDQN